MLVMTSNSVRFHRMFQNMQVSCILKKRWCQDYKYIFQAIYFNSTCSQSPWKITGDNAKQYRYVFTKNVQTFSKILQLHRYGSNSEAMLVSQDITNIQLFKLLIYVHMETGYLVNQGVYSYMKLRFSSCKTSASMMKFPYWQSVMKEYEREIVSLAQVLHMDNFFVILLEEPHKTRLFISSQMNLREVQSKKAQSSNIFSLTSWMRALKLS